MLFHVTEIVEIFLTEGHEHALDRVKQDVVRAAAIHLEQKIKRLTREPQRKIKRNAPKPVHKTNRQVPEFLGTAQIIEAEIVT